MPCARVTLRLSAARSVGAAAWVLCAGCSSSAAPAPANALPPDAGVADAVADAPLEDADAGVLPEAAGPGCAPGDVSGFQPPPYVPIPGPSTACSGFGGDGGLVQAYGDGCLSREATYFACAAVVPTAAEAACYACLVAPETPDASSYSIVVIPTVSVVNYAGCVQALDPSAAGLACATAIYDAALCAEYACKPTCPVTDEASREAFIACTNAAVEGACTGYALSAAFCVAAEQGDGGTPVATVCFGGATEEDHYASMARYFCGAN